MLFSIVGNNPEWFICKVSYFCAVMNGKCHMNIYKITQQDLKGKTFAFKTIPEYTGNGFPDRLFIFDGLLFIICISGKATITIDYKEYLIAQNDLVAILPKHICKISGGTDDLEIMLILVSADFLHHLPITPDFDLLKRIVVCPCAKLDEGKLDDLQKIHSLIEKYDSDDRLAGQIQDTLVQSMILMSASLFGNVPPDTGYAFSRQETLVRKFFYLLIDSCETKRDVPYYAGRLCISPKYLTTVVKSVSNRSAQSWINEAVLVSAKRYIMTTELTINQIADRLHFHTTSSFVRFFRIHTGLSPLKYKKRMNQDL